MPTITVRTRAKLELVDITADLQRLIAQSAVTSGVCHLFVPHTTAAITINEHADPAVVSDMTAFFRRLVPPDFPFTHEEGNSAAHILSSLVGCQQTLLVEQGQLVLGTWQGVFFCEFDGPRTRTVLVKVK